MDYVLEPLGLPVYGPESWPLFTCDYCHRLREANTRCELCAPLFDRARSRRTLPGRVTRITATEIRMRMAGPPSPAAVAFMEHVQSLALKPAMDRIEAIMRRRGLLA